MSGKYDRNFQRKKKKINKQDKGGKKENNRLEEERETEAAETADREGLKRMGKKVNAKQQE